MASKDKNKYKSKNIFQSFKYAHQGLVFGFKNTRNLQIDVCFAIIVTIFGFIFKLCLIEWVAILLCFALVMSLELVNTAIEEAVNLAMPDIHPIAKISKDVAAGAVMLSALFSVIIGIIIFLPKIISLF